MVLSSLKLNAFKNHLDCEYMFNSGINFIVGRNGIGKTNLLDAINYLSFGKTALHTTDTQSIRKDYQAFTIRGIFIDGCIIACGYEFRKGKTLKVNGKEHDRVSEHIGFMPLVFTTPDDSVLIREGSEFRRKFFDRAIAQIDREFLQYLFDYNKILKQRNEHLKSCEGKVVDDTLMDTYDSVLLEKGVKISHRRKSFLAEFIPYFETSYTTLHEYDESPKIIFESDCLASDFHTHLVNVREKDVLLQRTTLGAHRDRYQFELNDQLIRKFGSQGQQKTFIISLRLAEFDLLKKKSGKFPLLLLDDVFDKLDNERISQLVKLIGDETRFEQVFITDARKERYRQFFEDKEVNIIELK